MSPESINKIIFIGGAGRSGSTLLDMLIGQMDGFCSTGEVRFIWDRCFGQNQLCGCGKPFKECDFWVEVVKEAFGGFEGIDHARIEELRRPAESRVSNEVNGTSKHLAPYREYFDACSTLYGAIHKVSRCEFIVDSSKNIVHGFILSNIREIDLFTVHLIRDSRAVAYSWRREKIRPEIHWEKKFMAQRGILKSASRWNSLQMLAQKLRRTSQGYTLLRYEDLVRMPEGSLSKLFADLGIERPSLDFLDGLHANLKTSHTVSGNPVRFTNKEIKIQPDMQWQHAMARHQKWLVTLITWPLLLKYGYLRNGHVPDKPS
jgi:sulfotransferase family protein